MVFVDLIGGIIVLVFAVVDAIRGAARVVAGILAMIMAAVLVYFFVEPAANVVSTHVISVDWRISYLIGGLAVYLVSYFVLVLILNYLLKNLLHKWRQLDDPERPSPSPATSEKKPVPSEKKKEDSPQEEKAPAPSPVSGAPAGEDEAEEIQVTIMERVVGAAIGGFKGILLVSCFFLVANILPSSSSSFLPSVDNLRDSLDKSAMGKIYNYFVAGTLESMFPEFKIANNFGYIVDIRAELDNLDKEEKKKAVEEILEKKEVVKLLESQSFKKLLRELEVPDDVKENPEKATQSREVQRLIKNPTKLLQDPRVRKFLSQPEVKEAIADIDFRKIRDQVQKKGK